jgi:hypothetical protein
MTSELFGRFIRRHCTMVRQHRLKKFFILRENAWALAGPEQNRSKCFPLMRQTGGNLYDGFPGNVKAEGSILKPGN